MQRTLFRGDRMSLAVLLLSLAVSAITIISCGSGGSSNGGLCEQCGDDPDGPCQASVEVQPGPHAPACDNGGAPPCTVALQCFRKRDSAQRALLSEERQPPFPMRRRARRSLDARSDGESDPDTKAVQQTVRFSVSASVIVSSIGLTVTYPNRRGQLHRQRNERRLHEFRRRSDARPQ